VAVLAEAYGVATPEPEIDSAWSHITPTGGGMACHNHGGQPGDVRTGATVFYLQLEPANAAAPESGAGAVSYLSVVGDEEVLARPEVGLLTSGRRMSGIGSSRIGGRPSGSSSPRTRASWGSYERPALL
jgi:hypothetical protein